MPRVKIGTNGVSVELEANEASVEALGKQALQLYKEACAVDAEQRIGGAAGFTAVEPRGDSHG